MKILLLSDEPNERLWDRLDRTLLEGIDLILSCGDLPASYLSFLTCFTDAPILYVHGNHDASYAKNPPEGCTCIEDKVYTYRGVRIVGLGGSMRYKPGPHQYTDRQMARRVRKLSPSLRWHRGCDVIVAHSPLRGVGDADDLAHRGFESLKKAVERYQPKYYVHGHVHKSYDFRFQRARRFGETCVVNAWMSHVIEIDPIPPRGVRGWLTARYEAIRDKR